MPDVRRAPAAVAVALLVLSVLLGGCGSRAATPSSGGLAPASAALAPAVATTDLPSVSVDQLPPEAVDTLLLIAAGGPFPYAKDGATFGNRERLLPLQPNGFYREYTVLKPGEDDRGPWRIVTGDDGSRFWTMDHYASFEEVVS